MITKGMRVSYQPVRGMPPEEIELKGSLGTVLSEEDEEGFVLVKWDWNRHETECETLLMEEVP
jgi:hypothetical protein